MISYVKRHAATIFLAVLLCGFLGVSFLSDPSAAAKKVRASQVVSCQRAIQKANIIVAAFNRFAVDQEANALIDTNPTQVKRDIETAQDARKLAAEYYRLTPQDCSVEYPAL